jgi:hypothetical protein
MRILDDLETAVVFRITFSDGVCPVWTHLGVSMRAVTTGARFAIAYAGGRIGDVLFLHASFSDPEAP